MYKIKKTFEIAGCHRLELSYESKCSELHGHNWIITVYCRGEKLDGDMLIDFTNIKKHIQEKIDHKDLNDVFDFNPTAERIAEWICKSVSNICPVGIECYRADVQESSGNVAIYEI